MRKLINIWELRKEGFGKFRGFQARNFGKILTVLFRLLYLVLGS